VDSLVPAPTRRPLPTVSTISPSVPRNLGRRLLWIPDEALRNRVFSDANSRKILESILHPLILDHMENIYQSVKAPYCIFSIPLLLESDARSMVDRILVIDCPVTLQIERACNRDKVSASIVESIIRSQVSREERLNAADDVIMNDNTTDELQLQVSRLNDYYLKLANKLVIV